MHGHSGNTLQTGGQAFARLPYTAPEVLRGEGYTTKVDRTQAGWVAGHLLAAGAGCFIIGRPCGGWLQQPCPPAHKLLEDWAKTGTHTAASVSGLWRGSS